MAAALSPQVIEISRELQAELAKNNDMPLYDIVDHLSALYESAEGLHEDDPLRAQCEAEITAYEEAEIRKVDGICRYLAFAESQVALEADEAKRHQTRRQNWEKRIERIEASVMRVLTAAGKQKLDGRRGNTLKLAKCPPSIDVTDLAQVPQEFIRVEVTESVMKDDAKRAWKTAGPIAGLHLVTDKQRVARS